jgi:hypothetical protein
MTVQTCKRSGYNKTVTQILLIGKQRFLFYACWKSLHVGVPQFMQYFYSWEMPHQLKNLFPVVSLLKMGVTFLIGQIFLSGKLGVCDLSWLFKHEVNIITTLNNSLIVYHHHLFLSWTLEKLYDVKVMTLWSVGLVREVMCGINMTYMEMHK